MAQEVLRLDWVEREARHPELQRMLRLPFSQLLQSTARELLDLPEPTDQDPTGEWSANATVLKLAENNNATESLQILLARHAVAAVYEAKYRGKYVGQVMRPVPRWGIAVDADDRSYYWSEDRHGGSPGMFVLAAVECDDLPPNSLAVPMMHWWLGAAVYMRAHPEAAVELGGSSIPPLDLKARLGITDWEAASSGSGRA